MSAYSSEEQAAYDVGFKLGKSLGATGVEFNAISKKKWTSAYQHQIDELIKENEQLREQLAAEQESTVKEWTVENISEICGFVNEREHIAYSSFIAFLDKICATHNAALAAEREKK